MTFVDLLKTFFMTNGMGWMIVGLFTCLMLGGLGSSTGLHISGAQMAGALSEKPDLFGKLLVIMALPGTQGVYAFVLTFAGMILMGFNKNTTVMVMDPIKNVLVPATVIDPITKIETIKKVATTLSAGKGIVLCICFILIGVVQYVSAIYQGKNSAAAINMVVKQPEKAGGAILIPALVETYALLAFVAGFILLIFTKTSSL
jgi:V/A-type H+-transporting ATPase subunit K